MKRHTVGLRLLVAAICLAVTVSIVSTGRSQQKAVPRAKTAAAEPPQYTDAVTLPRNPESKRLIQAAEDYLKSKEWRTVGECLQQLLETPEDSFIDVGRKNEQGQDVMLKVSVRAEANRLIGTLPPEGLESYQLQYGRAAQDRLNEAVAKADASLLAEVSQRFLHTKAGSEATQLLGTYHLDRGQYLMASLCYERLLLRPDADQLPPKVLFRAALAARRSGNTAGAAKLWSKFVERLGRAELTLGKLKLTPDKLRGEFEREIGVEALGALFDWPIFRGNASRSAQGQGGAAFLEYRWKASLIRPEETVYSTDKGAVLWIEKHLDDVVAMLRDKPVIPATFPIAANGRLLVRAYDGVVAYALRSDEHQRAGQMLWRARTDNSLFVMLRNDEGGKKKAMEEWYNRNYRGNVGPQGVAFENSVTGCMSHDGQRVYLIDDLAIPPHPNQLINVPNNGQGGFEPLTDEVYHNKLYAVTLDDGKLSWYPLGGRSNKGGMKPADPSPADKRTDLNAANELQDCYFLGPPLPLGGKLLLLVEKNAELRLICLDASKLVPSAISPRNSVPEVMWVQSLGTAQQKLPLDGLRRMQAAHLAYGDGILVCPTNAGAVLGVDLLSHSLVWAYSYRKVLQQPSMDESIPRARIAVRMNQQPMGPTVGERWRTSAPVVTRGKVVFTAHDGTEVHCLNLRDGRQMWTVKRDENNDLYLAGVFDDRVLIVAKNSVRALNLETGQEVWKRLDTGLPSGQGTAADGVYYLPLANSVDPKLSDKGPEVCAIDIKSGTILGHSKSRGETPGNLLFMDGELVSQSIKSVTSFPLLKVKQADISADLAKNPNDPTGLTERGELHLYNLEVREAVADLRSALANQPPAEVKKKARMKLHDALTTLLQRDFAAGEAYLGEYEELSRIDVPAEATGEERQRLQADQLNRQATYLELVGKGREKQGRWLDAFAAYEKYGELSGHRQLVESLDEPTTRSRPDIWSRGRIQALLTAAKPEEKQQLEAEIAKRWDKVRIGGDLNALRKFVDIYGSIAAAGSDARLELTRKLLTNGDPELVSEAERHLALLCYSGRQKLGNPATAAQALDLMIRVCISRGQYESAVGYHRQLAEDFPDIPVRDGRTGKQLFDELITDKRFIPYLETPTAIWSGPLTARRYGGQYSKRDASIFIEPTGERSPYLDRHRVSLEISIDGQSPWSLRSVDRITGVENYRKGSLPRATYLTQGHPWDSGFATIRGHTLVMQLNNMVYAFDVTDGRELWTYSLFGRDPLLSDHNNQVDFNPRIGVGTIASNEQKAVFGRIAAVEASYVAVQHADKLVALDPSRPGPSVMWEKSDVPAHAIIFGDERHLIVHDAQNSNPSLRSRAISTQDGSAVPLPAQDLSAVLEKKVRMQGTHVLLKEPDGAVRLYDVLRAKDVWQHTFASGRVTVECDDAKLLGVIEPNGLFTLMDSRTGAVQLVSRLQSEHVDKLQTAHLLCDRDRYYLALVQEARGGSNAMPATAYFIRTKAVNGPLYALNRSTGKLEWVCDFLPLQSLVVEQWTDMPILLFASQFTRKAPSGVLERMGVKVTAVAKSTGKLIFDEELIKSSDFHALTAQPMKGLIELERQDSKVVFSTADAAALPEPVGPLRRQAPIRVAPRLNLRAMPLLPAAPVPAPLPPPAPAPKGG